MSRPPSICFALFAALAPSAAAAHDFYTTTRDPVTAHSCCGGMDCAPVPESEVRLAPGGYLYLPTGELIPHARVQQAPDWQFHRCKYLGDVAGHRKGETRCFFAPGGVG
jgi:hypothetical protein